MAYDHLLANRIREALMHLPDVEEKEMFSGMTFLVDGKMCVGVSHDELMCRFDPAIQDELCEKPGFRIMKMKERVYNGYGFVTQDVLRSQDEFMFWVNVCLEFNPRAKASKKKK